MDTPLPIPNREVKHQNADDSGKAKIGSCKHFFYVKKVKETALFLFFYPFFRPLCYNRTRKEVYIMIKEKNVIVSVLLSFVTCGIYNLYWMCTITEDVDTISENQNKRNGAMVILLTIITCGIYGFYWWYQNGKMMEEANSKNDKSGSSNSVLFLILAIFGLSFINSVLVQLDINKYATQSN